jgi:hypothetical protein
VALRIEDFRSCAATPATSAADPRHEHTVWIDLFMARSKPTAVTLFSPDEVPDLQDLRPGLRRRCRGRKRAARGCTHRTVQPPRCGARC